MLADFGAPARAVGVGSLAGVGVVSRARKHQRRPLRQACKAGQNLAHVVRDSASGAQAARTVVGFPPELRRLEGGVGDGQLGAGPIPDSSSWLPTSASARARQARLRGALR